MHEGILVAVGDWPRLHQAIEHHAGTLSPDGPVPAERWLDLPGGEDAFHVVSLGGRSYLLDGAMVLSSNLDLVVSLSADLESTVASIGAETVSGTYWLVAAEKGHVRRLHWNVRSALTKAFDLGEPLSCERRVPLEDVDGNGLLACLAELGFDVNVITNGTPGGQRYLWTSLTMPEPGALSSQIDAHHKAFARTDGKDWTKQIKVVARGDGGFDLRYGGPEERKKSFLKRLFGR